MNKQFTKRTISFLICLVMLLTYLPAGVLQVDAASEQAGILSSTAVADPSTLNSWKDTAFNPYDLTTEHAGGVWTDKTVVKAGDINTVFVDKNGDPLGLTAGADNFLVALSALGANSVIAGQDTTPTDTVFVLDLSNSMENTDLSAMVSAANDAIHSLLTANTANRVGVVVYSTNVNILLPLDRYTPVQKGADTTSTTDDETAYIEMTSNYSQIRTARITQWVSTGGGWPGGGNQNGYWNTTAILKNSSGTDVDVSVSASGATFIQGGLYQASQMFANATVTDTRTPVLVLMSDGAPSYGTTNYTSATNRNVGDGSVGSITDGLAFLTQLTAAYVKEKIADKYNTTAYFYSVGLGVSEDGQSVSIAESVLDTSKTRQNPENWWSTYLGLANKANQTMSFSAAGRTVSVAYDATITSASKNYTDRYFPASDASQLSSAFKSIVNEINLKASYNVTRIDGTDVHSSGYVTFVDEIGTGMELKDIKGILIGDTLYTGANLARALLNSEFGTAENPTDLGNNMVWALKQRLGITDLQMDTANGPVSITATERIHDLIQQAYDAGQIAYNAATGEFSNLIGWFSDANGDYLGFWDATDPNCTIPAGAAYANASYGMLGTTTSSQTAHASDMMYVAVMVSKKVTQVGGVPTLEAKTPQLVTFRVPASLLPTVTYQINVEVADGELITEQTPATITYNAADPIRLVYEVGVHSELTPENIQDFLREGYASKDADGNYYLYTNAWYWEPSTGVADPNNPPTKDNTVGKDVLYDTSKNHITYAYFEPSEENEHYYFTEDTDLYTYNGTSYVKLTTAPVTDGSVQYYFQHKTFVSKSAATQTGVEVDAKVHIHYGKVSQKLLADSGTYAVDATSGVYYIKKGTMHYETIHEHDKLKGYPDSTVDPQDPDKNNLSGSFRYRLHQLVDIAVTNEDATSHHFEIAYLGNNGRITYSPAQGFTLNKVMAQGATATGEFTFDVTVDSDADGWYTETRNGVSTRKAMTNNAFPLTLAAGQSVSVTGLDVGATYTVTEQARDGYTLGGIVVSAGSVNGATATGTVAENQLHSITYTNDLQQYGSLLVTKTVTYNKNSQPQSDPHAFQITARFDGLADKKIYANGALVTLDANGEYRFSLTNGAQMLFTGIPEGTIYTVTEDSAALTAGYSVVAGTFTGPIKKNEVATAGVQNAYTPEDVVIDNTDPVITLQVNKELIVDLGGPSYLPDGYNFLFQLQRYNAVTGQWDPPIRNATIRISNPSDPSSSFYGDGSGNRGTAAISLSGIPFDSVGSHYFRVKEEIPANLNPGWTYDRTHHDFKVIVTDSLDGTLKISSVERVDDTVSINPIDDDNDTVTDVWAVGAGFTNSYVAASTKLTLAAKKTLTGATLKDGQFDFALYETGDDFDITATGVTHFPAKNGASGDIIFISETYPFTGNDKSYYYVMKETSVGGNGITVDETVWEIEVVVSANGSNAVISKINYRKKGETTWSGEITGAPTDNIFNSISFNNTYAAAATTLQLFGDKTLTNLTPGVAETNRDMTATIDNGDFIFQIVPTSHPGMDLQVANNTVSANQQILTSLVQAGGNIDFLNGYKLYYTTPGHYEYAVTETQSFRSGTTIDTTEYIVKVDVVDNGLGQLVATPTYWIGDVQAERIVFNNTYTASPVTGLKIHANKVLNVSSAFDRTLKANDFRATLTHPDGTTETVFNDANGNFNFADLSFDSVGTYDYSISEVIPVHAVNNKFSGVTYDAVLKDFTIVVEDDGNGNLIAKLNGSQTLSATSSLAATITNTYEAAPTSIHLLAHKDLDGRALNANEFSFKLEAITSGAPMPTETVVKNDADGNVDFGTIPYHAIGEHTYKITEQKLDENGAPITADPVTGKYVYKGVTYDLKEYTVTVRVDDLHNGHLIAHMSSVDENGDPQPGGVVFTNSYEAAPVTVNLEGDAANTGGKRFTDLSTLPQNKKDLDDYAFKFVLAELDGTVIETVEDNGAGFAFEDITYSKVGTHQYLVYEVPTNEPGVTYDLSKYRVTVTVTDNGEGSLEANVAYEKAESSESDDYETAGGILFENTYKATEASVSFAGKKTLTGGRKLKADDFSFILKDASGKSLETVKNKADGTFAFTEITYQTEGTYVYTLEEVQGDTKGITYDNAKYTLTVTVADVNGELKATTVITKDTAVADTAGFTNIYTPEKVSATISVQKELVNKSTEQVTLEGFKFLLDGKGEKHTLTSDSNGKAELTLSFTAQDVGQTYTFNLSEIAGDNKYMDYDKTVYEITVAVSQAEDGQLQLDIKREGTGAFKFVNTYNGAPKTTTPQTGDSTNLPLVIGVMLSSVVCLFVLILARKHLEEQQGA